MSPTGLPSVRNNRFATSAFRLATVRHGTEWTERKGRDGGMPCIDARSLTTCIAYCDILPIIYTL